MPGINLSNPAGRDAVVNTANVRGHDVVRWLDSHGRQISNVRVLKSALEQDVSRLQERFGQLPDVAEALIDGDPEIDMEQTGRILRGTSRVYVDNAGRLVHRVKFVEVVLNPDGSERDRRPREMKAPNVSTEVPIRWSGMFISKAEACRRFVFSHKLQIQHINGLTYDFLFDMAKELESQGSLMILGGGPKSNEPLILRRGGSPYRGFLEGRTKEDKYQLILHFSNLELKCPPPPKPEEEKSKSSEKKS